MEDCMGKRSWGCWSTARLNTSQQCAQVARKAHGILPRVSSSAASRSRRGSSLCTALVGPHLSAVLSAGPSLQCGHGGPGAVRRWAWSCEGLEHKCDGERLRELGWVSVGREAQGGAQRSLQLLKGGCGEWSWCLLPGNSDRTGGDGLTLCQGRFRLGVRKHFFPERAVRHWHNCPGSGRVSVPGGVHGRGTEGHGQWAWWGWVDS